MAVQKMAHLPRFLKYLKQLGKKLKLGGLVVGIFTMSSTGHFNPQMPN